MMPRCLARQQIDGGRRENTNSTKTGNIKKKIPHSNTIQYKVLANLSPLQMKAPKQNNKIKVKKNVKSTGNMNKENKVRLV